MKYYNEFERRPKFIFIWMIIVGVTVGLISWVIKTLGLV